MEIIKGDYNQAIAYIQVLEEAAREQIKILCNQEFVTGSKICIMPDAHAGAGCTIGTTMTITDKIVPNLVGVDIGCGVEVARIKETDIDFKRLDDVIHKYIPSGYNIRKVPHQYIEEVRLKELRCYEHVNVHRAKHSIGTLGGGNHFIELNKDTDGNVYVVIHSGSRHIGVEVAKYYQTEGYKQLNGKSKVDIASLIETYKKQGREAEIQAMITSVKQQELTTIPKELCYVEGQLFEDYLHDMKIIQEFAVYNRKAMMDTIMIGMRWHIEESFTTIHNYIDVEAMILRKGAVSAKKNEKLIIPINMRDGSLLCLGKGNPDWNYSAPHGAGRLMSRTKAKKEFTVTEFENAMTGIYTTTVNKKTLDECPMAYKNMKDIVDVITDTVEILKVITPIYNFKAEE